MQILIVKIGAIGDVAMSLCMLPHLRKKYPDAKITWVCGQIVAPLLMPLVDELIEVSENELLAGSFSQKLRSLLRLWKRLFLKKFDLVLTAHRDSRYKLISWPVRAKTRRFWDRKVPGRYHAREYLRLATGGEGPEEPPIEFPEMTVQPLLKSPLIAIAPGGAKNILQENAQRRWPVEYYREVISHFSKEYQIVVTGAKSDEWTLPFLPEGSFTNLIGKVSLLDLLGIYKTADLLITHDSGPLHLAKLVHCPTLALFGPTNPAEFTMQTEVIWGGVDLPCRPCYDGKEFAACKNNLCMKSISPQTVISRALVILNRRRIAQDTLIKINK